MTLLRSHFYLVLISGGNYIRENKKYILDKTKSIFLTLFDNVKN
jgi:hypothetical protein